MNKEAKFRRIITKRGTLILAGKDAETNEQIIKQAGKDEDVFHTESAGSPFVNIKGSPKREDIKDAAIFCAKYSREWKSNKQNVIVHKFKGRDVYKTKEMGTGSFGVKKFRKIKVKKQDIENFEKTFK